MIWIIKQRSWFAPLLPCLIILLSLKRENNALEIEISLRSSGPKRPSCLLPVSWEYRTRDYSSWRCCSPTTCGKTPSSPLDPNRFPNESGKGFLWFVLFNFHKNVWIIQTLNRYVWNVWMMLACISLNEICKLV